MSKVNTYKISKDWFTHAFGNNKAKSQTGMLLFWILNKMNTLGWVEEIDLPTDHICSNIHVTPKTLRSSRDYLADHDFIDILTIGRNHYIATRIKINSKYYSTTVNETRQETRVKKEDVLVRSKEPYKEPDKNPQYKTTKTLPNTVNSYSSNSNELEPPKKTAPKRVPPKKAKTEKKTEPLLTPLTKLFTDFYLKKKEIPYDWRPKDSVNLKSIITSLRKMMPGVPDKIISENFEAIFLHGIEKLPEKFFWENYTIPFLQSQFNKILLQVKKMNNGQIDTYSPHAIETITRLTNERIAAREAARKSVNK